MLASPLTTLIVEPDEPRTPGSGPVSLPRGPVAGAALADTRKATRGSDARLHIPIHAAADGVAVDREQVVDPATDLVLAEHETHTMGAGDTAQIIEQDVSVTPKVS